MGTLKNKQSLQKFSTNKKKLFTATKLEKLSEVSKDTSEIIFFEIFHKK